MPLSLSLLPYFLLPVLLAPDFDTCQGGVLERREVAVGGERWIWQADGSPFGVPVDRWEIKLTRFCWAPVWQVIFCLE